MPTPVGMFRPAVSGQTPGMATDTALLAAHPIPTGDAAPEWVHLLPAGEAQTVDGRGPFRVVDAEAMMSASLAGAKLAIDENHSTDLAAPKGQPAPAHGWIVEMQSRQDGIWGRVEWIDTPGAVPIWKRYRGISPVIRHDRTGTVSAILRASLTNTPNLAGLTSLHSEEKTMDFKQMLLELLGLGGDADEAAITAAIAAKMEEAPTTEVALQAALAPIARAVGVAADADAAKVLAGVQALKAGGDDRLVALQSEVATLTTSLNAANEERAREKATAFVDAAIGAGRVGLKPVRDEYIAMHMTDRLRAEKLVNAMPVLAPGATALSVVPAEGTADNPALLSAKAGAYQKKLAEAGTTISFAAAVRAVSEGKSA
jgi:phage I-like protein